MNRWLGHAAAATATPATWRTQDDALCIKSRDQLTRPTNHTTAGYYNMH